MRRRMLLALPALLALLFAGGVVFKIRQVQGAYEQVTAGMERHEVDGLLGQQGSMWISHGGLSNWVELWQWKSWPYQIEVTCECHCDEPARVQSKRVKWKMNPLQD